MFQTSVDNVLLFSSILFQYRMCTIPFKLAQGFKYWLIEKIKLNFLKLIFKTYLNAFALNMFLTLKIMNFENILTRVFYFYFIQSMGE